MTVQPAQDGAMDRMEQFHESMRRRAEDGKTNRPESLADEISAKNADQIFSAETEEDIWNAGTGGTIQGRDAIGLELKIWSYRPDVSTRTFENERDNSKGYYVTIDATVIGGPADLLRSLGVEIGQEIALQTGADDVIYRLRAFELHGLLPVEGVLAGIKTASDNVVLKLRPLPKRAVKAQAE